MDLRRLRFGEWLAAGGGTALLVALFLPWYDEAASDASGWRSLAVVDVVLAVVAVCAVALLVLTASQATPAVPVAMDAIVCLAGLIGVVLTAIKLASLPGEAAGRGPGVWLGVVGTLGVAVGSALAMRDERRSPGDRYTDLTGKPSAPPPEIEAIPAPRL